MCFDTFATNISAKPAQQRKDQIIDGRLNVLEFMDLTEC